MFTTLALGALAVSGAAAQFSTINTATSTASVYAAQATAKTSSPSSKVPGKAFDRFITIWLENTDFTMAAGDPNLAALAQKGITLENYFGVTHPSQPNYVASIGGDNFGMDNDNFNFVPSNVSTIIDLLEERGVSWGEYQEDMPYTGYEGFNWVDLNTTTNDYVRKHNPAVIYDANSNQPQRLQQIKNFTLFYEDLENDALPQWSFITPNMTDDGHDSSVTVAGDFVARFLTPLLSNPKFLQNTLVLVTFDENHTYTIGNRVFSFLVGDAVPEHLVNTTDSNFYDHYSEIATVEANWDLHTLGRWDVGANVFSMVAEKTGDFVRSWDEVTGSSPTHFLNSSYPGAFNEYNYSAIPVPNVQRENVSPGRVPRSVLPAIAEVWGAESLQKQTFYTNCVQIPDGMHPPKGYAATNN